MNTADMRLNCSKGHIASGAQSRMIPKVTSKMSRAMTSHHRQQEDSRAEIRVIRHHTRSMAVVWSCYLPKEERLLTLGEAMAAGHIALKWS